MIFMNKIIGFVILLSFVRTTPIGGLPMTAYVKGLRCNMSETYYYPNVSCFGKSYNRSFSTFNILMTTRKPANRFFFDVILSYKYGTIFREVMHTPRLDWCEIMRDASSSMITEALLTFLRDNIPTFIHECPYQDIRIKDAYASLKTLRSIFPQGDYRFTINVYDLQAEPIGTIHVMAIINSPLKESFG